MLAIELIRLVLGTFLPVIVFSICSRLLPRVSGTQTTTKNNPTKHIHPNNQKVPDGPMLVRMLWNVFVTMNVQSQLNAVHIDAAAPLIFAGNISPIISHGMGPKAKENPSK